MKTPEIYTYTTTETPADFIERLDLGETVLRIEHQSASDDVEIGEDYQCECSHCGDKFDTDRVEAGRGFPAGKVVYSNHILVTTDYYASNSDDYLTTYSIRVCDDCYEKWSSLDPSQMSGADLFEHYQSHYRALLGSADETGNLTDMRVEMLEEIKTLCLELLAGGPLKAKTGAQKEVAA